VQKGIKPPNFRKPENKLLEERIDVEFEITGVDGLAQTVLVLLDDLILVALG